MLRMDPGHVEFYEGYGTVEQTELAQVRAVYTDTPSTYRIYVVEMIGCREGQADGGG